MDGRSTEETIGEMVQLERELTSTGVSGTYEEGTIASATKLPASEVPADYPLNVDTENALHLTVDTEGGSVQTFLEWPDDSGSSDHIDRLLDALGRDPDEFADIYGDRVALAASGGWHTIDVERTRALREEAPNGTAPPLGVTVVPVAAAVGAGAVGLVLLDTPLSVVGLLLGFLSWPAVPAAMYYDIEAVGPESVWAADRTKWLAAGAIPMVSVVVGTAYLLDRYVRSEGVEAERPSRVWYRTVLVSLVVVLPGVNSFPEYPGIGSLLLLYSVVMLPLAIYFDAEHVEDATDWDPRRELWAIAAAGATVVAMWWAVGIAYLLVRRNNTRRRRRE